MAGFRKKGIYWLYFAGFVCFLSRCCLRLVRASGEPPHQGALEVVDQDIFVTGLAELAWRLAQGVYGVLQLLDLFVADLGVEGVPEFALLEQIDAFEVVLVEVGIAQEPACDVFLVGPEVDAPGVQLPA